MNEGYDLLVCIRCHKYLDLVLDTEQSVRYNTNPHFTKIVFAVDGGHEKFAAKLIGIVGQERVYVAGSRWGWGAGLYSLLVESIVHFRNIYNFVHFQSIDYDTLYLGPNGDRMLLDMITDSSIGLLGCYSSSNEHWQNAYNKTKAHFNKIFGTVPDTYTPGEGVQGGYMTLTRSLITAMDSAGMFKPPFSQARTHTFIADDHLLPIFVRMCGLSIVNTKKFANCRWNAERDPRGSEKEGVIVFHPTKISAHNHNRSTDLFIRNYFRELRGAPDLLK